MVLIGGAALLVGVGLLSSPQQTTPPTDPAPLVRRLAATAQLAGALVPWSSQGVGDQLTTFAALAAIAIATSLAVGSE